MNSDIKFGGVTRFIVDFGQVTQIGAGTPYAGEYEVDPDFEGKVLKTKSKVMSDDVTVNPIEVSRVSNPAGGKTIYIGGIING